MCAMYVGFIWGEGCLFPLVNFMKSYLPPPTLFKHKSPNWIPFSQNQGLLKSLSFLHCTYIMLLITISLNSPALALLIFYQPHSIYL